MNNIERKKAFYCHKPLSEEDIDKILLEDLPDDDGEITDLEDDEDEKHSDNNINQESERTNFDSIFEEEVNVVSCENDQAGINNSDVAEIEDVPLTSATVEFESNVNRRWRKRDLDSVIPEYTIREGVNEEEIGACQTGTDVMLAVIEPILDNLLFQSNLYATQKGKVLNLKKDELLAFLGINFLMGYHKLPSWKNYRSSSEDLGIPLVQKTMSRDRFDTILSNLHVNDNTKIPATNCDKAYKVRPLVSVLTGHFPKLYHGTRELSIDESMILFKGQSSMKQYNPMKPIKRGYKLWCLSDQKGYTLNFDIYQGKNENLEKEFENCTLGERVVLSLSKKYWGTFRKLYFDNYFTSIHLLERLKLEDTLACGTMRVNRKGFPANFILPKKSERGDWDCRISSMDIAVFQWKDNKVVTLASNFHGTETTSVERKERDGNKKNVSCPTVVQDYNANMGGVDHADRLRAVYGIGRRSKKWWHRLFWGMLEIAFVNAYVIYCAAFEKVTLLEYRRQVTQGLMNHKTLPLAKVSPRDKRSSKEFQIAKRRKTEYSVPKDVRLGNRGNHFVTFVENRGRCEVCSQKKIQSRPHSRCTACRVFLCCNEKKNCFSEYHLVPL